jgi:hypothetical protein
MTSQAQVDKATRRLFNLNARVVRFTEHRKRWSHWRRRHQARARRFHYKRRTDGRQAALGLGTAHALAPIPGSRQSATSAMSRWTEARGVLRTPSLPRCRPPAFATLWDVSYQPMTLADLARFVAAEQEFDMQWRLVVEFLKEYHQESAGVRQGLLKMRHGRPVMSGGMRCSPGWPSILPCGTARPRPGGRPLAG